MGREKKIIEYASLDKSPFWYKDAVIYELHVRAFSDGNGEGIGDFTGLTEKLDYLQDLGVTAIWLLPFYPSPLRDDGYDIANYTAIHPDYGTVQDFKIFLKEAHQRGLYVISELVINHTSDQHPWFQRAREAKPGTSARNFYVWNDDQDKYGDARIIFKDFEMSNWSWDPVAKAYYWHRFYAHQPDLNFDNPEVRKALFNVLDFWLEMGVDGLRLDAVPYLYEREGTNCENLPETHAFLKELRAYVDKRYQNRMLLAEANQWPEDAVVYFGAGDECHMAFHFPVMPRLFMATHMEDRFPIIDILEQTPAIPETSQWAVFLRNHDELTLEMVTDEDRDYMYKVYANDPQARVKLYLSHHDAEVRDVLRAASVVDGIDAAEIAEFCAVASGGTGRFTGRPLVGSYTFTGGADRPVGYSIYVPIRSYVDDDEQARDDLARISVTAMSFVAQSARGLGLPAVPQREIDKAKTIVERFMIRWRGVPDPDHVKAVDAYFVSAAEHGLNASTFTARIVASTGADGAAAISAAIGALSGPLHGGAPSRVLAMLDEVERSGDPVGYVKSALDRKERLMGFGHRVYRAEDPRARTLRRTAQELGSRRVEVAEALEKAAVEELTARYPDRPLRTNVEFWSAVVLDFAEVPPHMFTSMFTCARTAGWSAHIMEQKRLDKLIRPSARYRGPGPRRPEDVEGYDSMPPQFKSPTG